MKKTKQISLIAITAMMLAGCTSNDQAEQSQTTVNLTKICASINREAEDEETLYESYLTNTFEELNKEKQQVELLYYNVSDDSQKQQDQVTAMISNGCQAAIVELVDVTTAQAIADQFKAVNLPLIFVEKEPGEDVLASYPDRLAYVGADKMQNYTFQGEIISELPDKGYINCYGTVMIAVLSAADAEDEQILALSNAIETSGLRAQVLGKETSINNREQGKETAELLLKLYGDQLDVLCVENEALMLGTSDAIEAQGRSHAIDIYLVGGADSNDVRFLISNEQAVGSIWDNLEERVTAAAQLAVKGSNGETISGKTLIANKKAVGE